MLLNFCHKAKNLLLNLQDRNFFCKSALKDDIYIPKISKIHGDGESKNMILYMS